MPAQEPLTSAAPTIYFGYGSNLWLHQMRTRCPTSTYLGVARLNNYKWIINDRGYANVVELSSGSANNSSQNVTGLGSNSTDSSYSTVVFGLVYSLNPEDERRLDLNEGVPIAYTKEDLECDFWESENGEKVDVETPPTKTSKMLVYIDRKRLEESDPKEEYIYRMNKGIEDAIKMGVPKGYVDEVMRKFISKDGGKEAEALAQKQAVEFKDESGVM